MKTESPEAMTPAQAVTCPDFAEFLAAHNAALLWSSSDDVDGETVNLDRYELSTAAADTCRADCLAFFVANHADLVEAAGCYRGREEHGGMALAGHDFALTRNGHGAGFWDGDLPDALGDRLTEACKAAGQVEAFIGGDGLIYL